MKHLNLALSLTLLFRTHDPRLVKNVRCGVSLEDGSLVLEKKFEGSKDSYANSEWDNPEDERGQVWSIS